jgi:hypothetical protein
MKLLAVLVFAYSAHAELVRLEIAPASTTREILGRAHFAVDPNATSNRAIDGITKAPRNAQGKVEFSADFHIIVPAKPSGVLLFEASNRGGRGIKNTFDRAGDPLIEREGLTLAWVAWQHDVSKGLKLYAPVAKGVEGLVRAEKTADTPVERFSLGDGAHIPYAVSDASKARAYYRDGEDGVRHEMPPGSWKIEGTEMVLTPPGKAGRTYEVVYPSKDPAVAGLGFAAMRDFVSAIRTGKDLGAKLPKITHTLAYGSSQSGMALRGLLYEGFNTDEHGKRVFDGVFSNVAGGRRMVLNLFSQPSRTAGPFRDASFSRTDQPPYTDWDLLAKYKDKSQWPKIFYVNSSYEYWGSSGSLIHTTTDGRADVAPPETTRIFAISGGQHGPAPFPPKRGKSINFPSFNDYKWAHRSLLIRLRDWVVNGTPPPASRYPQVAKGELVTLTGYNATKPKTMHRTYALDFKTEPPKVGKELRPRIMQADADGNDRGGLAMPDVAVPLGAFAGWNTRAAEIGGEGELTANTGSYFPFTWKAIQERYGDKTRFLNKVREASTALIKAGYLFERDVDAVMSRASAHWEWRERESSPAVSSAANR